MSVAGTPSSVRGCPGTLPTRQPSHGQRARALSKQPATRRQASHPQADSRGPGGRQNDRTVVQTCVGGTSPTRTPHTETTRSRFLQRVDRSWQSLPDRRARRALQAWPRASGGTVALSDPGCRSGAACHDFGSLRPTSAANSQVSQRQEAAAAPQLQARAANATVPSRVVLQRRCNGRPVPSLTGSSVEGRCGCGFV